MPIAAILAAIGSPAGATAWNDIAIPNGGGSATSLVIAQDASGTVGSQPANAIAAREAALPASRAWDKIAIARIGGANTVTASLDSRSAAYSVKVIGTGNRVTNTVAGSGSITLNQGSTGAGIYGDNNSVTNSVSGQTNLVYTLRVNGSGNSITNTAEGSGATNATITQSIASSDNTIRTVLADTASGTQSSALTIGGGSRVDYYSIAAGANQSSAIALNTVIGAAQVVVAQGVLATGASAILSVDGGGYTAGTLGTGQAFAPAGYTPSVYVSQNSPGAQLNATIKAGGNGYTVKIAQ